LNEYRSSIKDNKNKIIINRIESKLIISSVQKEIDYGTGINPKRPVGRWTLQISNYFWFR
jgi:hypothetical protein